MDENNISKEALFEMMRQLVYYTDLSQDRKDYFMDLLVPEKYDQMTPEDAGELMTALPKAQEKLEKIIVDSKDPESIYALANLKSFTNDLMNEAEEKALQDVLDIAEGGSDTMPANISPKDRGRWLLNKLAGLPTEKQSESAVPEVPEDNVTLQDAQR